MKETNDRQRLGMLQNQTYALDVSGMHCGSCVGRVENAALSVAGVQSAAANLATNRIAISGGEQSEVIAVLTAAGYPAEAASFENLSHKQEEATSNLQHTTLLAAAFSVPVVVLAMGGHLIPAFSEWIDQSIGRQTSWLLQFILTTVVLFFPGRSFFVIGFPALGRGAPDMNSLVALGAGAAWVFSSFVTFLPTVIPEDARAVYFEASAVIVTLILLGRYLESGAKGRTGAAIEKLIGLQPQTAMRVLDGVAAEVSVSELVVGDFVQLRPGEKIAVDGQLSEGQTYIDESMMTGEPVAVAKSVGDSVYAGTINGQGSVVYRATQVGAGTLLAQIIQMVSDAQGAKLPVQDVINKITLWFVPAVLSLAVLTVVVWWIFGPSLGHAMVAGVSVLIIACPCAMGLATPTSIMVGMGRAAEMGVLFRKGSALQSLQTSTVVAFDKTGTLTLGRPNLDRIETCNDFDEVEVLATAAALEKKSEHPLAHAVITAAAKANVLVPEAKEVAVDPGYGISGSVAGKQVAVGAARYMTKLGIDFGDRLSREVGTAIYVSIDQKAAGILLVSDIPRSEAAGVVGALQNLGLKTALITGDNQSAANSIADQVGIAQIVSEVLPDGKVAALSALGEHAVFVGDGINDAPVLAAAHVGIAVGTGTDVAIESADVVLLSGDLRGVVNAFAISRATMRNIRQNLVWAFGYNVLLIPIAAGVLYPLTGLLLSPMLAAGAMALSSVFVVTNALRLRWVKPAIS